MDIFGFVDENEKEKDEKENLGDPLGLMRALVSLCIDEIKTDNNPTIEGGERKREGEGGG